MPKTTLTGKPDAGNLHVRFDEGEGGISLLYSTGRIARMRNEELIHSDLSEKVIGSCIEVIQELGSGFLEADEKFGLLVNKASIFAPFSNR